MSTRLTTVITFLALVGAFAMSSANAIDEAGKPTKAGSLAPTGEGPGAQGSAPSRSTDKSRASVKADTAAANRSGTLAPAGQATVPSEMITSSQDADRSMAPKTSTKSRSAVKDATKADRAAGTLRPAGEAPQPYNESPKK